MSSIPQLLVSLSGEPIDSLEKWETFRRGEVLSLLSEYIFGFRDIERPEDLYFRNQGETLFKGMRKKSILGGFGDYSFPFSLYLPAAASGPLPTFLFIQTETPEKCYLFNEEGNMTGKADSDQIRDGECIIPVKLLTDRGYAVAVMPTRHVYPDWQSRAEFQKGVFAAYKPLKKRQKNSWAGISAWAWGASRVMDYIETDPELDPAKVAVIGHSRGGKAALWTGATDQRFLLTVSNNSGCTGAAIHRGKEGEHIRDINISDWFCENYHGFNDREEMLPVDQHMLLALIAPRYVYVTSSQLDIWADPKAEYLACKLASPAFGLYGLEGLAHPEPLPPFENPSLEGHIAYHMKWGDHSIGIYDWENVERYFARIIGK